MQSTEQVVAARESRDFSLSKAKAFFRVDQFWSITAKIVTFLICFVLIGISGDAPEARSTLLYPDCGSSVSIVSARPTMHFNNGEVKEPYIGIWISASELAMLPTSGPAWDALKAAADKNAGTPSLKNQNQNNDVLVLAKALVYARTGEERYRVEVVDNLKKVVGTEKGGRTLALGRNLVSYVISADLVNLPQDPKLDRVFRSWLRGLLSKNLDGRTLRSTQELRPNNWGTHAGASRAAVALYLGDYQELQRAADVFQAYLGDTSVHQGFKFNSDLSWQCDSNSPVGVNPTGCMKDGHLLDGALPEEMRRGASFQWPPVKTGYAWEALQGIVVTAEILERAGYPAWEWQDQAIFRAVDFLYALEWPAVGDDEWQIWLINRAYGTDFPAALPAAFGKNMGWTDWTHAHQSNMNEKVLSKESRCQ